MQFSSKPQFIDEDPWVSMVTGARYSEPPKYGHGRFRFEPRPEYNRPQTNPTNRILTELRENKRVIYDLMHALGSRWADQFTWEEQEHAWAVLELLAYWRNYEED